MELEVKHVASYLPYELKTIFNLSDVINFNRDETRSKLLTSQNVDFVLKYCKLILRPLSDFIKEIEVNGRRIVPSLAICKGRDIIYENKSFWYYKTESVVNDKKGWIGAEKQLELFEKLFEWHFDVYGLIEAGLAIDINDINK